MPLKLKAGQVAVEPIYDSDFYNPTSRLIKIPEQSKERCDQGFIRDLGEGCDPALKIGDHIIFSGYSGTTVVVDNELSIIIHYTHVKGVIISEYIVPGLYLRAKVLTYPLEGQIQNTLNSFDQGDMKENEAVETIMRAFASYVNELLVPAQNQIALRFIADAAPKVDVKENPSDRDSIDENNR